MLVAVRLADEQLWERFNQVQNEMIITKGGRCLFPLLRLTFEPAHTASEVIVRLVEGHRYSVGVSIVQADAMRWRFRGGRWHPILSAQRTVPASASSSPLASPTPGAVPALSSPAAGPTVYLRAPPPSFGPHPSVVHVYEPTGGAPVTAAELLAHGLNFSRIKLTNQPYEQYGQRLVHTDTGFSLTSFHKYLPLVLLFDHDLGPDYRSLPQVLVEEPASAGLKRISFPATSFIAVTHYQNETVTMLKKSFNPHAKGFLRSSSAGDDIGDSELSEDELLATETLARMISERGQIAGRRGTRAHAL